MAYVGLAVFVVVVVVSRIYVRYPHLTRDGGLLLVCITGTCEVKQCLCLWGGFPSWWSLPLPPLAPVAGAGAGPRIGTVICFGIFVLIALH